MNQKTKTTLFLIPVLFLFACSNGIKKETVQTAFDEMATCQQSCENSFTAGVDQCLAPDSAAMNAEINACLHSHSGNDVPICIGQIVARYLAKEKDCIDKQRQDYNKCVSHCLLTARAKVLPEKAN